MCFIFLSSRNIPIARWWFQKKNTAPNVPWKSMVGFDGMSYWNSQFLGGVSQITQEGQMDKSIREFPKMVVPSNHVFSY